MQFSSAFCVYLYAKKIKTSPFMSLWNHSWLLKITQFYNLSQEIFMLTSVIKSLRPKSDYNTNNYFQFIHFIVFTTNPLQQGLYLSVFLLLIVGWHIDIYILIYNYVICYELYGEIKTHSLAWQPCMPLWFW